MCSVLTEHSNEGLMRVEFNTINGKFRIHYLTLKSRTGEDCFANVEQQQSVGKTDAEEKE